MRAIFLLFSISFLVAVEYDCIIIGTSPFSLFEALYQYHSGKTVLILEESEDCGGAWKSINICGIPNADLGCHQVGKDKSLKTFLEEYAGCQIISLDTPELSFEENQGPNGWYFSQGCHELIDHLLELIRETAIELHNGEKAETFFIDPSNHIAVQTKNHIYYSKKLILTPMCSLSGNPTNSAPVYGKSHYYHLYLLIYDPTPFRFTYRSGVAQGMSRMMNLTYFVGLSGTNEQLIAIQVHSDQYLDNAQQFLDSLKSHGLVDESAHLLDVDAYVYESATFNQKLLHSWTTDATIEILQTGHIQNLSRYIPRWKEILKPWSKD